MVKEFGYEYDAVIDEGLWKKTKGKFTEEKLWGAVCLRSGRDALKVVAREFEPTIVFMPALACDSMVLPFEMYGHKVVYYKLNKDYSVDFNNLVSLIPNNEALFLYMDYFGNEALNDEELKKLKADFPKLIFIEDRTPTLIQKKVRIFKADYTVASLRKWVNIPDGGLLWTEHGLSKKDFSPDFSFASTRLSAQCMRNKYLENGDQNLKIRFREIFGSVSDIMDNDKLPARMSAYSYEIAKRTDFEKIRIKRKDNATTLINVLKQAGVQFIQSKASLSDQYVAFMVEDRDFKQRKLSLKGIFNTIIWPLSEEQKNACSVAKYTDEHMLAATCDQRYNEEDMVYIGKEMVKVFHG